MAKTTVSDVIAIVERIAPPWMAGAKDRIGLHAGDPRARVRRVLVALDATLAAVREARQKRCQMLVVHHPRFHQPLDTLDESTAMGRLAAEIARSRLAVYAAHTNLDTAPGGVNDVLAELAGIAAAEPLTAGIEDPLRKLVVFVPESHLEEVRQALCDAGAGVIGEYSDCSFRSAGIGTFRGSDATKPFVGSAGRFEEAEEWRLEVVLPRSLEGGVVRSLRAAHPYEEPAFDLYQLADAQPYGCGRIGQLIRPTTLAGLARRLKKASRSRGVLVLGDPARKVARVAVWSGGGCPVRLVVQNRAEAVALGEIGYHELETLDQAGVGCVALGHAESEEVVLPSLAESLRQGLPGVEVEVSTSCTPHRWSA